jgi:hypothetical protein
MLETGRLVGHVPPAARGFTILTPVATVVDLGTEFGVESRPEETLVHVFQGEIEVSMANEQGRPRTAQRITAGKSARFERQPSSAGPTEVDPGSFVRSLPGDSEDLLVYEPFGSSDFLPLVDQRGGLGFGGSPWTGESSRTLATRAHRLDYPKNVGLAARLGHFENSTGKFHEARQLRRIHPTNSINLAHDGEYYFSFLARKFKHDSLGLVGLMDASSGQGLEFGWSYSGGVEKPDSLVLDGIGTRRTASVMPNNAYQFFVVKLVARAAQGDVAYVKVYDSATAAVHRDAAELSGEGTERDQWTLVTPEFHSDLTLNSLSLRSDGPGAYVQFDEIRLGKTWHSVTGL